MDSSHSDVETWIAARRRLQAAGIDADTEARIRRKRCGHFFAMARVREDGERFDFAEDGHWRCILPELWRGEVVDLVAFEIDRPQRVTSRHGIAALLGEEDAERSAFVAEQALLWEDPLQWLRNACEGSVVLQFSPPPWCLAGCALAVPSVALAQRLRLAYQTPPPALPRLHVFSDKEASA